MFQILARHSRDENTSGVLSHRMKNTRAEVDESCEDEDLSTRSLRSRLLLAIWKIEESLDGYCTVVKKLGLAGSCGISRPEKVLALERLGLARVTDESSPNRVS